MKSLAIIVIAILGVLSIGFLSEWGDALGVLLLLWARNIERH